MGLEDRKGNYSIGIDTGTVITRNGLNLEANDRTTKGLTAQRIKSWMAQKDHFICKFQDQN